MKVKVNEKIFEVKGRIEGEDLYIEIDGDNRHYKIINDRFMTLLEGNRTIKADYFIGDKESVIWINGKAYYISKIEKQKSKSKSENEKKDKINSPLPGVITKIAVKPGDKVKEGTLLLIIESMKMANEIKAEFSGTVKEVLVKEGDQVGADDPLISFQ